jgi:hypothetical protein
MNDTEFTVRLASPITDVALHKFALAVSDALTRVSKKSGETKVVQVASIQGKTASLAVALYDENTKTMAVVPSVRFVPVGSDDVNIGYELDVSPKVGSGIGGTSQGYMANYGTVAGEKLVAGVSANNEDPNIPRLDVGFKPKRGAAMEMYGNDGDTANARKGQMRRTVGPSGRVIITRYVSGDRWEVVGGFGENHELICGWRNTGWPGSSDTWGTTVAPAHPFSVYARTGGVGSEGSYTKLPVATISDAGIASVKEVDIVGTGGTVKLVPTGVTGTFTLQLIEKTFQDGSTAYVLCSPSS